MSTSVDKMSSQVISYRLNIDEVSVLREKALPGESDNQTAQRLMREMLGLSTPSTVLSTMSTTGLDERVESVEANQNEILNRLQEIESLLNDLSATAESRASQMSVDIVDNTVDRENSAPVINVDIVDDTVDSGDRLLTQKELSERLGVHAGTLTRNRSKANFADWSADKDPEGLAWKYLPEVERYASLSTTLSTASTTPESEPNLAAWKARVDAVVGAL
jgi:hypothetical protein